MMPRLTSLVLPTVLVLALSACTTEAESPLAGGYAQTQPTSKEAKLAAEFAVKHQATTTGQALKLEKIVQSEEQVVAGMNYRMTLQVKDGSTPRLAQVVVYRSLAPQWVLTSWDWIGE